MKSVSPALQALLATRHFASAGLYTFTLIGGGVLRYTSYDIDVSAGGNTWSAGGTTGPFFDRTDNKAKCHWKRGIEVDTLVFDVLPGAALVNGQPFLAAVRQRVFAGAELSLGRAYFAPPAPGTMQIAIPGATGILADLFVGRVAEVDFSRSVATFNVNSHLELLNQNLPLNLYQAPCLNTLFDVSCALNRASFAVAGTAAAGSTTFVVDATLAQASGYFDLGSIVFTSGANNGVSRTVKSYSVGSPGMLVLLSPLPNAPAPGDTFTAYPGCDKTQATCTNKFSNLVNFRGFPYVPVPETAV